MKLFWHKRNTSQKEIAIDPPIDKVLVGFSFEVNKKGQVVAVNAVKSLAYSYVISHLLLKTITSRNRPQRRINDDNPVVEPWTKNPWDFGNYGKEKSYSYSIGMRWLL